MRPVFAALFVSCALALSAPVHAQAPRAPRVVVDHERGPIRPRELRAAWTGRRFRRCQDEAHDDVVHLHVRIDADGSVRIDHGLVDGYLAPELRCVFQVLTAARFSPQTEATYAHVTVYFRPTPLRHRRGRISARSPGSRPLRAPPRR